MHFDDNLNAFLSQFKTTSRGGNQCDEMSLSYPLFVRKMVFARRGGGHRWWNQPADVAEHGVVLGRRQLGQPAVQLTGNRKIYTYI
jgi:hypothetical protein